MLRAPHAWLLLVMALCPVRVAADDQGFRAPADPPPAYARGGQASRPPATASDARQSPAPAPRSGLTPTCREPRDLPPGYSADGDLPPCARAFSEIAELYTTAALFGFGTGALIANLAGWDGRGDESAGGLVVASAMAALGVLAVNRLDAGDGLAPGLASAMSSGVQLGFVEGFVFAGAVHPDGDPFEDGGGTIAWGGAAAGAIVGTVVALGLSPTAEETWSARSGGIWGLWLAAVAGRLGRIEDDPDRYRLVLTGLNAGIVGGAILSGWLDPSFQDLLHVNAGGLVGTLVAAVLLSSEGLNPDVRDAGLLTGGVGGMVAGALLLGLGERPASWADDLRFSAQPRAGGAELLFSAPM